MLSIRQTICPRCKGRGCMWCAGRGWQWIPLFLALCLASNAATFYVDFSTGGNANPGTKLSPWKFAPGMQGFSATYTHAAGDHILFKGGVTWPNACFPMVISNSGATNNEDYYGPDKTWFTGGSWTQPLFDAGHQAMTGTVDDFIHFSAVSPQSHVTFDNLNMANFYWTGGLYQYDQVCFIHVSSSTYITIENCWMHNWDHGPTNVGTTDQLSCVFGYGNPPWNQGCVITNCVFDGETTANKTDFQSSGGATFSWGGSTLNCVVTNMMTGFLTAANNAPGVPVETAYNHVQKLYHSFDPSAHPDGLQCNFGGLQHIHDNVFSDCATVMMFIGGGGGEVDFVWNNLLYNFTGNNPILIDTAASGGQAYVWNNTIVAPSANAIRVDFRSGGGALGVLSARNNHCIGPTGLYSVDTGASIATVTNTPNIIVSSAAAAAQGYTLANLYAPVSIVSPTVDQGVALPKGSPAFNGLTRPQLLAWDIGAYEYPGFVPPPPPTGIHLITLSGPFQSIQNLTIGGR